ncbi:MAG TPA: class I SAM-dependent methyltransferase, partial [Pseudobacillus sp.]
MTYERFARVYDFLMEDAPYEKWLDFFQRHVSKLPGRNVLDLACGTGELTWRLAEAGWNVTGVDLSDSMLFAARQKAEAKKLSIPLFQQDMRDLEGLGQFDAITIF